MNNLSYDIYPGITISVKKWICKQCFAENISHPYCCCICKNIDDDYSITSLAEHRKNINKKEKVYNIFKKNKILLPVLSCSNFSQFKNNIQLLDKFYLLGKIQGIWITSANCEISIVESVLEWIKNNNYKIWIGVNLIGENIFKVLNFIKNNKPDGIWIDNSYFNDETSITIPEIILDQFERFGWNGLYFGGVMFKYQTQTRPTITAELLKKTNQYIDVLTTSGIATGIPIDLEKLDYINKAIDNNICIALASGISCENISTFYDKCDIFIIRTSIIDSDNNIIESKLNSMCDYFL
jgi:hypothetical protein